MANFLYATGEQFNSLERMIAALTVTNEDSELVRARLYDRDPGLAFRFGSVAAGLAITADLNILPGGDMETDAGAGLPPAPWSEVLTGTGDITRGTGAGEMDSTGGGAAGMKLTVGAGSGSAEGYQERYCRAGERIVIKARAKDAGAGQIKARLRNKRTGKWATSGGGWSSSVSDIAASDTTTWHDLLGAGGFEIIVEDFNTCQADRVLLRLSFVNDTINTSKFVDNVAWWPSTGLFSAHGHSIPPEIGVEWRVSTDNFAGSNILVATLTPYQSTFYGDSSAVLRAERYQRLLLPGTPFDPAPPHLGEWILTQPTIASRNPNFGFVETRSLEQIRSEGPAGKMRVTPLADKTRRALTFPVSLRSATDYAQFRDQLMERSQHGRWPVLVVSEADDPRAALYGSVPPEYAHTRTFLNIRDTDLKIVEAPFPTFL